MASHEELLQSIHSEMKLDKDFFLKIYGYEVSFSGFADKAIKSLNGAGCSRAQDKEMKKVAAWYRKECEKQWQNRQMEGEVKRIQKKQIRSERWTELSQILSFQ